MSEKMIFMEYNNKVHIIKIPNKENKHLSSIWEYARKKLNVPDNEITPWDYVSFNDDGIAIFDYQF